jgi:dTDP-glucose 4,6-dehydratase
MWTRPSRAEHFIQTEVRHVRAAQEARAAPERYLGSRRRGNGSIEDGTFTEHSACPSSRTSLEVGGDPLVRLLPRRDKRDVPRVHNYGPYQYPEKLIPLCILNALHGDPLPVYGDGMQVRNWLYVTDHCAAIDTVLRSGKAGDTYNIGGPDELPNIDVVRAIIELTGADESLIQYVKDRPGHDRRYSLSSEKTAAELGWKARVGFLEGIAATVDWYRKNASWWEPIRSGDYREYYQRQYGQELRS